MLAIGLTRILLHPIGRACLIAVLWTSFVAMSKADSAVVDVPLARLPISDVVQNEAPSSCQRIRTKLWRCASSIQLIRPSNVIIDGEGSKIEFVDASRGKGGIRIIRARNIILLNIEITWSASPEGRPILSLGSVTNCAPGERGGVLELDERFTGPSPLGAVSAWDNMLGWTWSKGGPDRPDTYLPAFTVVTFKQGRSECIPQLMHQVGRRVLARLVLGTNHAFTCIDCEGVTVEHVRVTSAPGMAFVFEQNASNIILRKNSISPPCHPECKTAAPSVSQDGIHIAAAQGPILIEENDFGWQGDDSVNITGLLVSGHVESRFEQATTSGIQIRVDSRWRGRMHLFRAKAPVTVYDHGLNVLGTAKVFSVDRNAMVVKLVGHLPIHGQVVFTADDRVPRNVVVKNNHFHDHRGRGILMGARHAVVEGNVIERLTMQGILVAADTDNWMEGPGSVDVLIRRNTLANVNRYTGRDYFPSAISAGVRPTHRYTGKLGTPIKSIRVENNSFMDITSNPGLPVNLGRGASGSVRR